MSETKDIISSNPMVCSSWSVLNDRSLRDALTLDSCELGKKERSLECMVSFETCVHLGNQDVSVPCQLEINLKNEKLKITEISIVSEARIIEIYGKCGEYLATNHAEFLYECEDLVVYITDFKFPQPSPECSLKFARMKAKGQMWLYGIYATTEKDLNSQESSVNFNNVNKILKESSHQITDKADKCKKFLQMYSSGSAQALPKPQTLLNVFDTLYLNQCSSVGNQAKSVGKCLSDFIPAFASFSKGKSDDVDCNATATTEKSVPLKEADDVIKFIVEEIKQHVDRQFSELAMTLTCHIDKRLSDLQQQQNQKLDKIIHLLQSKNNS